MPFTRRLFAGGVTYSNAYAVTPLCCPSRATILSGLYAHNHGVRTNADAHEFEASLSLPSRLGRHGYHTALFGKYLNRLGSRPEGFRQWLSFEGSYTPNAFHTPDGIVRTNAYSTDFLAARVSNYVQAREQADATPWFAYVAFSAPHWPFTTAPRHRARPVPAPARTPAVTEQDRDDKPPYVRRQGTTSAFANRLRDGQLRTLMAVDQAVGRVVSALRSVGELEETLIVFLSDNGFAWGEHGLRGKTTPYLESVRIPLMIWGPEQGVSPSVDARLTGTIDVAPTLLDAAGIHAEDLDGRSLLRAWEREHLLLEYWRTPDDRGTTPTPSWRALVSHRVQYVEYLAPGSQRVTFRELYDLRTDPWQLENALASGSATSLPDVKGLAAQLRHASACAAQARPGRCP